jgi:hypothetical protein
MKWSAVGLIVLVVSFGAQAADVGQGYGVGMKTCAQFAKDYAANPTSTEDLYFLWAEGFMSATNLAFTANTGSYYDLSSGDMASFKLHIRSYCNAHPLTQYAMAVMDLVTSLPPKKANSN